MNKTWSFLSSGKEEREGGRERRDGGRKEITLFDKCCERNKEIAEIETCGGGAKLFR